MSRQTELTLELLKAEAAAFADAESRHDEPQLYGVADGKAIGTYFEHKFQAYLRGKHQYEPGSTAKGIDLPGLGVDMKVTSAKRPQSSCPFRSARQKVYGLGYSLLAFVYEKIENAVAQTGRLDIQHLIFVDASRTADFQLTTGLVEILENEGNKDDLVAFMNDKMLPGDEISLAKIADELLENPPVIGYITISNALQWRLQYRRVIEKANSAPGVERLK